jgi:putative membrane protein
MSSALVVVGTVFLAIAAAIHVFIFVLESVMWSRPSTWRGFGVRSQADADVIRPMAFNQGFYNLFLALGIGIGLVLASWPNLHQAGHGIALFAAGSMVAAALVLIISSPRLARAAAIQGVAPLVGIALLAFGLAA